MANNTTKLQTYPPAKFIGKQNARNNSGLNLFHYHSPENKDETTNVCICLATICSYVFRTILFEHDLWAKDLPPHPSGHRCGRSNATPIDRSFHPERNINYHYNHPRPPFLGVIVMTAPSFVA